MVDITAIILTKDEEKNIEECLKSIKGFTKRVVIVDCGSTDKTVEIAEDMGADIIFHEYEYYAKQFNWGIDNANIETNWILRLDADERFTPALCKELEELLESHSNDEINGITMEARLYFLGKCITHGIRNKRKMMIFKTGIGRIEDRKRDAHSIISRGCSVYTKEKFLHYDFKDLDNHIKKYNWYATREMQDYVSYVSGEGTDIKTDKQIRKLRKKKFSIYYKAPRLFRAWLWFIYNYYFRLGFLDGREGYIFHYFECYWYRYLVDAKIIEYEMAGKPLEELKALD